MISNIYQIQHIYKVSDVVVLSYFDLKKIEEKKRLPL